MLNEETHGNANSVGEEISRMKVRAQDQMTNCCFAY